MEKGMGIFWTMQRAQAVQGSICSARLLVVLTVAGWLALASGCTGLFQGPQEKRASAQLLPTLGNQMHGVVSFVERADGVQVSYNLVGLPPNSDHALQVHEHGDCNASDASSAGAVFAPGVSSPRMGTGGGVNTGVAGARVEGNLGNIHADSNGVAAGFIIAPDASLDGVRSILQRAVIVHLDVIDPYAYPPRDTGPALGCGTIRSS